MNEWFEPDPAVVRGLTDRRLSRREFLRYAGAGITGLTLGKVLTACTTNEGPAHRTSTRELFVDDTFIDTLSGASLVLQRPQVAEMSLDNMDVPWEGSYAGQGPTVVKDGSFYRMWFGAAQVSLPGVTYACYAESTDGIVWTRPNLRLATVDGTLENLSLIHI